MDWHIVYAKFDGCKGFKALGVSPCAATSQERQSVLPDKVKGNGQTNHLPTISNHYGKAKD